MIKATWGLGADPDHVVARLALTIVRISAWRTRRSMSVVAVAALGKMVAHLPKGKLV